MFETLLDKIVKEMSTLSVINRTQTSENYPETVWDSNIF